jgi:hypothetical protein
MKSGELFSERKAQQSLDDLYGTGYFETVKLSALPCSTGIDLISRWWKSRSILSEEAFVTIMSTKPPDL